MKITSGGDSVDLATATTAIKYLSNSVEYDDIYSGPITAEEHRLLANAFQEAQNDAMTRFGTTTQNPVNASVATQTAARAERKSISTPDSGRRCRTNGRGI